MKLLHAFWLAVLLVGCHEKQPDEPIVFAPKEFFDSAQTAAGDGIVYIAGTLTGPGIGYQNNTTAIACYLDLRECFTYSVNQIGPNQIGRLDAPVRYPVTEWDEHKIVARDVGDAADCNMVTITIDRKSESALWVTEPTNQTRTQCKDANNKILKWTVEDSPGWKTVFRK